MLTATSEEAPAPQPAEKGPRLRRKRRNPHSGEQLLLPMALESRDLACQCCGESIAHLRRALGRPRRFCEDCQKYSRKGLFKPTARRRKWPALKPVRPEHPLKLETLHRLLASVHQREPSIFAECPEALLTLTGQGSMKLSRQGVELDPPAKPKIQIEADEPALDALVKDAGALFGLVLRKRIKYTGTSDPLPVARVLHRALKNAEQAGDLHGVV